MVTRNKTDSAEMRNGSDKLKTPIVSVGVTVFDSLVTWGVGPPGVNTWDPGPPVDKTCSTVVSIRLGHNSLTGGSSGS